MANQVLGPNIMGSPAPFRPLNPWGRPMPKTERIKSREPTPLYQVMVRDRDGKQIPLGPAIDQVTAARCCEALSLAQLRGKDAEWSNPEVVKVT